MNRLSQTNQNDYTQRVVFTSPIPLSVYCRATSATASPIFFRTSVAVSFVKQSTSFWRITTRWSLVSDEKTSLTSFVAGSLRVLVAIRRKSTAAKAPVCEAVPVNGLSA